MNDRDTPGQVVRFLRQATVLEITQLSRATLYELIKAGQFPKPLKLCSGRINVWPESAIAAWQQEQIAAAE